MSVYNWTSMNGTVSVTSDSGASWISEGSSVTFNFKNKKQTLRDLIEDD